VRAIETITGPVSVLWRDDVDTDQIIPKQFLKRVERTGFGEFLFFDWAKEDGWNLPHNQVLVAGHNFGCGSSREHAPWALEQYGFRALIAPSYADIFFNNCFKNGVLPIVLPAAQVARLFDEVAGFVGYQLTIDLSRQVIVEPDGAVIAFDVEPFRKYCLVNGFDDIGLTLRHADKIRAFEAERLARQPWLANRPG
jgi:3-isopropylmalate/(R)-2-methylmalate dehydratase small subunit